ncbi:MAG: 5'-nucleotidase C-terminal domain-containing protein [Prevotella sp.]|nr:5'-nucleotidase C-terminal domain-containing protein [Prevotella sp.]
MKRTALTIATLMCLTMSTLAQKAKTVTLRLVETSDVHGAFFPYNFIEQRPMRGSLARVSTYLKQQRQTYGDRLILMDNGDILQGQPTCYYTNFVKPTLKNVAAEVMNYLKYDAEAIGNHDVETGHKVYDKWIKELNCPTLGANIIDTKSGKPYVEPYLMLEREGVRIAVLGMLTPAIPNWLHESLWSGMRFEEMVGCARQWVKTLREKEQADVVVGLFHSGWEGGICTEQYDEDAAKKIAEQVEGFDVIFFGHDHTVHQSTTNGVLCLNPSCNAVNVAEATLKLRVSNNGKGKGRRSVKIIEKTGRIVDISNEAVDEDFVKHFQPQMDSVQAFVNRQIGTFAKTIRSRDAFFGSAPFCDYIHELQLEHTGADISFNAPLQFNTEIKAGPVTVSDMFKLYRYENQIYVLRMTGREVRQMLEMSYDQWVNTMKSPDDHIMLVSESTLGDQQRLGFKNFSFNFDSAAGIDYEVDVTKPNGQKVRILQLSDGRPFEEDQWYRVAMNSYRGNGGGELLTRGAGIDKDSIPARIEYMSERDQRYYLTQKIEREGNVEARALHNWCFVPEEWAAPAIERDRKILFKE